MFGLSEQENSRMEGVRVTSRRIRAGHAAVVGSAGAEPRALIAILQAHDVLARTPTQRVEELAELVDLALITF